MQSRVLVFYKQQFLKWVLLRTKVVHIVIRANMQVTLGKKRPGPKI